MKNIFKVLLAFAFSSCSPALAYHPDPLAIIYGGTGQISSQAAINSLAGAVTNATFLRGNGTNDVMGAIQVSDVPTLNQSTTGTASNITATTNATLTTLSALTTANSLSSASSLATVGTIGTGTWAGTVIAVNHGGTGQVAALNQGGITYGASTTAEGSTAAGTTGQFLQSNGTAAPSFQAFLPSSAQHFLASATYGISYYFYTASMTAAKGDTYTNNGATFTVTNALTSGTLLLATSSGAPVLTGGTLTRATGTGTASVAYTLAKPPIEDEIGCVGPGGGGGGSGVTTGQGGNGGTSANSTFGSGVNLVSAGFGGAGAATGNGGSTNPNSFGASIIVIGDYPGGQGQGYQQQTPTSVFLSGGQGGSSTLGNGGGGAPGGFGSGGQTANTGGGGGGGGTNGSANGQAGSGGSAGSTAIGILQNPSGTYAIVIPAGGAAGAAGTTGFAGQPGSQGQCWIRERWQ